MKLFGSDPWAKAAGWLYARAIERARHPALFGVAGVPDTLDGRFETLTLHVFLLLHRLKNQGPDAAALGRALSEALVAGFDTALREMGAGDLGVGRRVRRMADGFHGRVGAYDAALDGRDEDLAAAIGRNVYGTRPPPAGAAEAMAAYIRAAVAVLKAQPLEALLAGTADFGPPPESWLDRGGGRPK
jgi:cytochrome b pre-mRNA-processing protein 3